MGRDHQLVGGSLGILGRIIRNQRGIRLNATELLLEKCLGILVGTGLLHGFLIDRHIEQRQTLLLRLLPTVDRRHLVRKYGQRAAIEDQMMDIQEEIALTTDFTQFHPIQGPLLQIKGLDKGSFFCLQTFRLLPKDFRLPLSEHHGRALPDDGYRHMEGLMGLDDRLDRLDKFLHIQFFRKSV